MAAILEGIKVLDCTIWVVGPRAGSFLVYLGADVVHIERRGMGDPKRGLLRIMGQNAITPQGVHTGFLADNIGKRSLALDLSKQKGKELLYRLVNQADVFLTNMRPTAVRKLGLDYATLSKYNSKLIYASSNGFGQKGPDRDVGAYDGVAQARGGMTWANRDIEGRPIVVPGSMADQMAGVLLALGIMSALLAREKFDVGQELSMSQLSAIIHFLGADVARASLMGIEREKEVGKKAGNPIYNTYRCKDGKWMLLGLQDSEAYWGPFCKAAGIPELEKNPRFVDMYKREENNSELIPVIEKVFATKTLAEWTKICKENDFNFAPCQTFLDVVNDVQALENEYIIDIDHPVLGRVKFPGHPFHLSKTPGTVGNVEPQVGQHTEEILIEAG